MIAAVLKLILDVGLMVKDKDGRLVTAGDSRARTRHMNWPAQRCARSVQGRELKDTRIAAYKKTCVGKLSMNTI